MPGAPGAAGENFFNHGLKKIEGSEGAILDENTPFLRCFGPVSKSRIRQKRARGGGWPPGVGVRRGGVWRNSAGSQSIQNLCA